MSPEHKYSYNLKMRNTAHIFLATLMAIGIFAGNVSAYEFCLTACCCEHADMGHMPMGEVISNDLPHKCCGGSVNTQCALNAPLQVEFKCTLASSQPGGYRVFFSSTQNHIPDIEIRPQTDRAVLQAATPVLATTPIFIQNLAFLC